MIEKFDEKIEGPRYHKWVKKIGSMIGNNKLDLAEIHAKILDICKFEAIPDDDDPGNDDDDLDEISPTLSDWV